MTARDLTTAATQTRHAPLHSAQVSKHAIKLLNPPPNYTSRHMAFLPPCPCQLLPPFDATVHVASIASVASVAGPSKGDYIIIVEAFSGPFAASTVGEFTLSIECTDCASQPRLCVPPTPTAASECDAAPSHEGCTDTEYCGAAQQCYPCTQCALFNDQGCAERTATSALLSTISRTSRSTMPPHTGRVMYYTLLSARGS